METKFEKFQNCMKSIFGTHPVEFVKIDNESYCVRSIETGMFYGIELKKMIYLCDILGLNFYISYRIIKNTVCVEFVIH